MQTFLLAILTLILVQHARASRSQPISCQGNDFCLKCTPADSCSVFRRRIPQPPGHSTPPILSRAIVRNSSLAGPPDSLRKVPGIISLDDTGGLAVPLPASATVSLPTGYVPVAALTTRPLSSTSHSSIPESSSLTVTPNGRPSPVIVVSPSGSDFPIISSAVASILSQISTPAQTPSSPITSARPQVRPSHTVKVHDDGITTAPNGDILISFAIPTLSGLSGLPSVVVVTMPPMSNVLPSATTAVPLGSATSLQTMLQSSANTASFASSSLILPPTTLATSLASSSSTQIPASATPSIAVASTSKINGSIEHLSPDDNHATAIGLGVALPVASIAIFAALLLLCMKRRNRRTTHNSIPSGPDGYVSVGETHHSRTLVAQNPFSDGGADAMVSNGRNTSPKGKALAAAGAAGFSAIPGESPWNNAGSGSSLPQQFLGPQPRGLQGYAENRPLNRSRSMLTGLSFAVGKSAGYIHSVKGDKRVYPEVAYLIDPPADAAAKSGLSPQPSRKIKSTGFGPLPWSRPIQHPVSPLSPASPGGIGATLNSFRNRHYVNGSASSIGQSRMSSTDRPATSSVTSPPPRSPQRTTHQRRQSPCLAPLVTSAPFTSFHELPTSSPQDSPSAHNSPRPSYQSLSLSGTSAHPADAALDDAHMTSSDPSSLSLSSPASMAHATEQIYQAYLQSYCRPAEFGLDDYREQHPEGLPTIAERRSEVASTANVTPRVVQVGFGGGSASRRASLHATNPAQRRSGLAAEIVMPSPSEGRDDSARVETVQEPAQAQLRHPLLGPVNPVLDSSSSSSSERELLRAPPRPPPPLPSLPSPHYKTWTAGEGGSNGGGGSKAKAATPWGTHPETPPFLHPPSRSPSPSPKASAIEEKGEVRDGQRRGRARAGGRSGGRSGGRAVART